MKNDRSENVIAKNLVSKVALVIRQDKNLDYK